MRSVDDRTARARIRDAALVRFAADGFAGTPVRRIAEDAGVSPALVLHHFGSKEGLRAACDAHVIDTVRAKASAVRSGGSAAALSGLDTLIGDGLPVVRYLGRLLVEGGPDAAAVVDDLVESSQVMLDSLAAEGVVHPTADPRMRTALLVAFRLSMLLVPHHIERATGSDPLSPDGLVRVSRSLLELLTTGLFTDATFRDAFRAAYPGATAGEGEPT